jgi:hypothetical protein
MMWYLVKNRGNFTLHYKSFNKPDQWKWNGKTKKWKQRKLNYPTCIQDLSIIKLITRNV